ncbi:MAG: glycosyltransferase family 4 protein [Proteiniphilum sp.]|nr:glycosyltransferase family 4 protein [Proteiniphilum sp.]
MKVLFVSSANSGISPIVEAQGLSLQKAGIELSFYGVKGKGILGYLSNMSKLLRALRKTNPHVVHAHYSFCGIVSAMVTRKPVIVSLMGSDVKSSGLWRVIIRFFVRYIWKVTIVKSDDMKSSLGVYTDRVHVIPNGVDLDVFKALNKSQCRKKVGWDESKRIVLFAANPERPEKNFELAKKSFLKADLQNSELKVVYNVKHEDIPLYLCASDVLISTSKWEGSPNIIKEAMACNIPIVSTDVGDVNLLFDGVKGCFVTAHDPDDIAIKLNQALRFEKQTNGRERLIELGLDSERVAIDIIRLYKASVSMR